MDSIKIRGAQIHNLDNIDLEIPRNQLVVISGVSGSGKSSLAFDTIFKEAQRRYLATLSSKSRGRIAEPSDTMVEEIRGISPAIALDQKSGVSNPRSTVGTLSELYDFFRLLFARCADDGQTRNSSLFSFNSPVGACPDCNGLGVVDRLDPGLLVADSELSIRQGALRITTPNGYLMYSQVTLEVLNQVCNAHGFHIDIPWKDLSESQLDVVLNGSERIKIPYGKHPLSSRLNWSGIEAKPREEGYYKGILPVMSDILRRDRNPSILRFAQVESCPACDGSRLSPAARGITVDGSSIVNLARLSLCELSKRIVRLQLTQTQAATAEPILAGIQRRLALANELQLGYLTLARDSSSLSGGEAQRLRLVNQIAGELQGILYVLDEPSIGLHPHDNAKLLGALEQLRDNGNSVLLVEHEEATIQRAQWLIDLGPGAGISGGQVTYEGPLSLPRTGSPAGTTLAYLSGERSIPVPGRRRQGVEYLEINGASKHNLRHIDVRFALGVFNVVTGVSGAGKNTLVFKTLVPALTHALENDAPMAAAPRELGGHQHLDKLIVIDQSPIGRTPRSNPATYTKLFDHIRALFADTPDAKQAGLDKGSFSFNVKGGRCETCQGSGVEEIGMHFLGHISVVCDECEGHRFHDDTLSVQYRGKNIADVLGLSVAEALEFFSDQPKIQRFLHTLSEVGLAYLTLGQPSTTLSGGEAQRIKLAAQLARPSTGRTLFVLNEPTTGLHSEDVAILLDALNRIVDAGNTIVAIEHNTHFIKCADRVIDLGPGSGSEGGSVVAAGTPEEVASHAQSLTGKALAFELSGRPEQAKLPRSTAAANNQRREAIELKAVRTNNLKGLTTRIPHGKLTVVTGVSGSGKSSLAFDTIHAEGHRRFAESLSTGARRYLKQFPRPPVENLAGINATIAVGQHKSARNPRSTVATLTEIYDLYRLLYSRAGQSADVQTEYSARAFSFNHSTGACPHCNGLGSRTACDPPRLVTNPSLSLLGGALAGTKTGRYFGEEGGRYTAMLRSVGQGLGIDYEQPFENLTPEHQRIALHGTGERQWSMLWQFNRKGRRGEHAWEATWPGFCGLINVEYERVHGDKRADQMLPVMCDVACPACHGRRLKSGLLAVTVNGLSIADLTAMGVDSSVKFFEQLDGTIENRKRSAAARALSPEILKRLSALQRVGLGYLTLDRQVSSLSGGEHQRVLLASRLGADLCSVTYVLDEPTIGLHGRDTAQLLGVVRELRDQGNTIVVVEHDEQVIRAADHIIDMGPGAGSQGGEIVAEGPLDTIISHPTSVTGRYLAHPQGNQPFTPRRAIGDGLRLVGARANNLRHIDVHFPKGGLVAVSGVSGSGKSSLVFETLLPTFTEKRPVHCDRLDGAESFSRIIAVDQSPIGRTLNSTPVTYCGLFDRIRTLFAAEEHAKQLNLRKSAFSFASKGGRCETCQGMGRRKIEMGFLADLWIDCDSCRGARYQEHVLQVRHLDKTIAEVLALTVDQAATLFTNDKKLATALNILSRLGLGYLGLGQAATTLSGGEAQRLKLAAELIASGSARGKPTTSNLYLFDEPTAGLHFDDIATLLRVFGELADAGHTLIVVEHNLDMIAAADWVIDLGPEGGNGGGMLIAAGTPADIAATKLSPTGQLLNKKLTGKV